jgi:hypothetical protein
MNFFCIKIIETLKDTAQGAVLYFGHEGACHAGVYPKKLQPTSNSCISPSNASHALSISSLGSKIHQEGVFGLGLSSP